MSSRLVDGNTRSFLECRGSRNNNLYSSMLWDHCTSNLCNGTPFHTLGSSPTVRLTSRISIKSKRRPQTNQSSHEVDRAQVGRPLFRIGRMIGWLVVLRGASACNFLRENQTTSVRSFVVFTVVAVGSLERMFWLFQLIFN